MPGQSQRAGGRYTRGELVDLHATTALDTRIYWMIERIAGL